jgi:hypothetical protein
MFGKFFSNMFHIRGQPRDGCFAHASRFNHSRAPNCAMTTTSNWQQQCHTIKNISDGEELTFSYKEAYLLMPTRDRQEDIATGGYRCTCVLCTLSANQRLVSDMRRQLMRHLAFIWRRRDLENVPPKIAERHRNDFPQGLGYTWPMILQAKLAEAENLVGKMPRVAYAHAMVVALQHAQGRRLWPLPSSLLMSIREWSQKAQRLKRIHSWTGTFGHDPAERTFHQLRDYVDRIGQEVSEM